MNIDNSCPLERDWLINVAVGSSQIWLATELQHQSHHRYILCVACQPEHRSNNTAGVAMKDGLLSQVGSPRSVGFAILSTYEHCRNKALRLHAIIKIPSKLTGHLAFLHVGGGRKSSISYQEGLDLLFDCLPSIVQRAPQLECARNCPSPVYPS
jgi:hypothetical protein